MLTSPITHPARVARIPMVFRLFNAVANASLPPGHGGAVFRAAVTGRVRPALKRFSPDLIVAAAGFDAHASDPLANRCLNEEDFRLATRE